MRMSPLIKAELAALPVRGDCRDMLPVEAGALNVLHLAKRSYLNYDVVGENRIQSTRHGLRFALCMVGSFLCRGLAEIHKADNYRLRDTPLGPLRARFIRDASAWCEWMEECDERLHAALRHPKKFSLQKFNRAALAKRHLEKALDKQIKGLSDWDTSEFCIFLPQMWPGPVPVSYKVARKFRTLTSELAALLREHPKLIEYLPTGSEKRRDYPSDLEFWGKWLEEVAQRDQEPAAPFFFEEPATSGPGRPAELYPRLISEQARGAYERLTGLKASRRYDPMTGSEGPFEEFLDSLFSTMGIKASTARQVRWLMDKIRAEV